MNVRKRILSACLSAVFVLSLIGTAYAETPMDRVNPIEMGEGSSYSQMIESPDKEEIDTASLVKYGSTTYKVVVKNKGQEYGTAYTVEGTSSSVTIPAESYSDLSDILAVEVIPVYKFDLGSLSDVEPGMTGVDASTDFASNGYGFTDSSLVENKAVSGGTGAGKDSVYFKTSGEGSFDVAVADGEYAVTIMNGGSGRVNPWAEGLCMGNDMFNTNEVRDMQIMVSDSVLNLQIRNGNASNTSFALSYVEMKRVSVLEKRRINVFFGGDSTVYGYDPDRTDLAGIGQMLPLFLPKDEFVAANYGVQGYTTEIYLNLEEPKNENKNDKFDAVEKRLQPGDYHLIQLGINDQSRKDHTITKEKYGDNLRALVTRTREKGAVPVLITPQGRYGEIYRIYYSDEMEKVAQEMQVPLIDNRNLIGDFYTALGGNNSEGVAPYIATKTNSSTGAVTYDGLHLSPNGALNCARSVAERLRIQIPEVFGNLYTTTLDDEKLNPLYNADLKVNFSEGKVIAKAQMQWLGIENAPQAKTFVALYGSEGQLVSLKARTMQLNDYSTENCTAPVTATLIWDNVPEASYAKMFLWDAPGGARQMKPLANAVTVEESNFVPDGTETETPQTPDAPVYNKVIVDNEITGGRIIADKSTAAVGDTVKITVEPDNGYQLKTGTLTYNGIAIDEDTLTFIMPDEDVTITAQFEAGQGIVIKEPKVVAEENFDKLPESWTFSKSSSKTSYHINYKDYEGALTMNRNANIDGTGDYSSTGDKVTATIENGFDGILKVEYEMIEPAVMEPKTSRTGKLGLYSGSDLIFESQYNKSSEVIYTIDGNNTTQKITAIKDDAPQWLKYDLLVDTHNKIISGTITSKADGTAVTIPETALNNAVTQFNAIIATANTNIGGVAMDNFKVTQYETGAEMASIKADDITGINDSDNTTKTTTVNLPRGWSLLSAVSEKPAVATAAVENPIQGTIQVVGQPGGGITNVRYTAVLNGTDYKVSGTFSVMVDSDKAWMDSLATFTAQAQDGDTQDYDVNAGKVITMTVVDPKDADGTVIPVYAEDFTWTVDAASAEKGIIVTGNQITVPKNLAISISEPIVITVTATGTKTDGTMVTQNATVTLEKALTYLYGPIDYEDGSVNGWTNTGGAGTYENVNDTVTEGIGKHMRFRGSNGRSYILDLPTAITQNFVFEADITLTKEDDQKVKSAMMGEFAILSSSATYDAKSISNKGGHVLKLDMPKDKNVIIVNNPETQISNSSPSTDFREPLIQSTEFPSDSTEWMHVKVLGNFDKRVVDIELTSYDGTRTYFAGQADMSDSPQANDVKKLLFFSGKNDSTHQKIDNVSFRLAEPEEIEAATYYKVSVTTDLDELQTITPYYIKKNSHVSLTDHQTIGYDFLGWKVNGEDKMYTTAEVNAMPITADTSIVAQYSKKSGYVETLESVGFKSFPANDTLVMSADGSFNPNLIALSAIGERKSDFSVTEDTTILWEFTGFRTKPGGEQTGDPAGDFALNSAFPNTQSYCDTYATVTVDSTDDPDIEFMLKNTSMNFYGRVKATVTYKGKTLSIERPLIILGDTSKGSGQLLPDAGYTENYSEYEDISGSFGEYVSQYSGKTEAYLGNWLAQGTSAGESLTLKSEAGGKYLRLARGSADTAYAQNEIDAVTQQTIFSQDVRFGGENNGFALTTKTAAASDNVTAFQVTYSGGKIKLNNTAIANATADTWYRIVVSADPSTDKCYAKVYSMTGEKLGESAVVDFNTACDGPAFYRFSSASGNIDFNNVTAFVANVSDDVSFTLTAAPNENITIPTGATAATAVLTAEAFTADGTNGDSYPATGTAVWTIDDPGVQAADVKIVPDARNSAVATVSVYKTAASGNLPISVNIGGIKRTITLKLTGTTDSLAFTSAPNSLLIPAEGNTEFTFTGEVRGGDGTPKAGAVAYAIYDKTNTTPVSNPSGTYGITLDANTGKLTVGANAVPSQFTVRATSGALSRGVTVNMYNWKFDFGSGAENTLSQGYTSVSPSDLYSDEKGYGIVGSTAAGTSGDNILDGDYVEGTGLSFRVKVQKGKVYDISMTFQGKVTFEEVKTGVFTIPGIEREGQSHTDLSAGQYSVAVVGDGVLDINVSGKLASVTVTAQKDKTAGAKRTWISTGDSTVAQNPSWAYVLAGNAGEYPELYNAMGFQNKGRGARHLTSYYTEGIFDDVLQAIRPGDVVSLTGWGTNYSSGAVTNAQFKEYLEYYIDAVEDMGGYVILGSYSSEGSWSGDTYDENSLTFKGSRLTRGLYYDVINKAVYDERSKTDDKIIGFLDVGAICDEFMTAKVRKAYQDVIDAGGSTAEAQAAADALADSMLKEYWPKDQHYTKPLSDLILSDLKSADGSASDSLTQHGKGIITQVIEMVKKINN
jgi:lysophospholipase L1-like esterase